MSRCLVGARLPGESLWIWALLALACARALCASAGIHWAAGSRASLGAPVRVTAAWAAGSGPGKRSLAASLAMARHALASLRTHKRRAVRREGFGCCCRNMHRRLWIDVKAVGDVDLHEHAEVWNVRLQLFRETVRQEDLPDHPLLCLRRHGSLLWRRNLLGWRLLWCW